MNDPKVIIVGAGPTGMTAALDLAYFGIPSLVLDEDHQLSGGSRAIAYHHTTLEVWEKLGAAGPMLAKGVAWSVRHTYYHDRELFTQTFPSPAPGMLPRFFNLQQSYVEAYLLERIQALPLIDLRWDHRVVDLWQEGEVGAGEGVTLAVETPTGKLQVQGDYVLACDGARSTLRRLLALDFPGVTHNDRFLIADVRTDLNLPPEPRFYFDHPAHPGQTTLIHPQPDGVWRMDWQVGPDVDVEHERSTECMDRRIRALIGDAPYEIVWLSDYRFHQRLLPRFIHGRVFFLGDAAHLVAPFGAHGLNSAVQDVDNLAWKLALVLQGSAPETLLESYQTERWPAQQLNQQVTDATMLFMAPPDRFHRLLRDAILRLSAFFPPARRRVDSGKMNEPFVYSGSPLVVPDDQPAAAWKGAPPLGGKVPDAPCTLATASGPRPEFLRHLIGAGFVALYFCAGEGQMESAAWIDKARGLPFERRGGSGGEFQSAGAQSDLPLPDLPLLVVYPVVPLLPGPSSGLEPVLVDADGSLARLFSARPGTLYLVRPDGHVAARCRRCLPEDLGRFVRIAVGLK